MNESIYLAGHEWHRIYEYTPFNGQVEMLQFNVDLVCSLVATPNKLFVLFLMLLAISNVSKNKSKICSFRNSTSIFVGHCVPTNPLEKH